MVVADENRIACGGVYRADASCGDLAAAQWPKKSPGRGQSEGFYFSASNRRLQQWCGKGQIEMEREDGERGWREIERKRGTDQGAVPKGERRGADADAPVG